jgi:hypothetical protein
MEERFDDLTRNLGAATSRRQALKVLGATVGGLLAFGSTTDAMAKKHCRPNGSKCHQHKHCCSGICDPNTHTCRAPLLGCSGGCSNEGGSCGGSCLCLPRLVGPGFECQ